MHTLMENEIKPIKDSFSIDSFQLLSRFVTECKEVSKEHDYYPTPLCSADILTAVYYYRVFPDVTHFIEKIYKNRDNYFQLQWIRNTWNKLSNMNESELSELVIKQISSVTNFTEEQ